MNRSQDSKTLTEKTMYAMRLESLANYERATQVGTFVVSMTRNFQIEIMDNI